MFRVWARKFICLLVRVDKGIMFGWQTSPLTSYQFFRDVITGMLFQGRTRDTVVWFCWPNLCEHKFTCLVGGVHNQWSFQHCFQSLCLPVPEYCVTSHKDRVVIVPHDLIGMIHGLVWVGLDQHLHLTPVLLDSEAGTPLPSRPRVWHSCAGWNLFLRGRSRTNWPYLSERKKLAESCLTYPGTKFFVCFVRTVITTQGRQRVHNFRKFEKFWGSGNKL